MVLVIDQQQFVAGLRVGQTDAARKVAVGDLPDGVPIVPFAGAELIRLP
jgi:hypothetical protein